ncbi:MAG TPA: DNA (cytosine-5-)-methyltransferase [Phenylobacterium sp.]|uniref:DNA cytosine methyltransferase n=1 Tax=Phenylobacterium sp. TaxID=1871053 RepID=UPI002C6D1ACF|nr:DNA (cytosine-5-)-methyltransferase [Phenylobacterium sp.]HSV02041.1 DNA (cytosine-5-)-methyltransferase [Phenylobacterium sp.]
MQLKAISLYSGIGGLDFGFEAAGFETAVALDLDGAACASLRLNRNWPIIEGDISRITSDEILRTGGLAVGEADILIGGPPCQPFSKSGYWATGDAKRLEDPRANTLHQYLRVLRDTQPAAFLLENVLGLAYSGKSEGVEHVRRGITHINAVTGSRYSFAVQALNAAEFGVPQLRERVFIIGFRDGRRFRFPTRTHAPADESVGLHLEPFRSAWDALGDLPSNLNDPALQMTGKWSELLPSIPEGSNYLWHTPRGGGQPLFGWRTRFWNFLLKLAKDQPSWTIQAQPGPATGPFHWSNRRLSAAEMGRLQTFPDGLVYPETRSDAQRLIGNAVPSALAEVLAREIRGQLFREEAYPSAPTLIPQRRAACPRPEPVASVPQKYMFLAGDHHAHPGTGKGRRAATRLSKAA